ncbi:PREDICTED: juvenile hormone acid O-methyltransferase-like, partial [Dinoponera quadriceps]|uniref:Juvenile hormone acid O-methyltransferase-like n=1 Tax=Dinoponera quadriceps TaxID=609295 RepID=A0A6P3Y1C6_DINQU
QAFSNIYEMLQPGGTVFIHLVASHDIFDVFNQLSQNPSYASYIPDKKRLVSPFQYSTNPQKELRKIVRDVGFHILHCSHRETTTMHIDSHKFLSMIMSFMSFLDYMPQKLKTEFNEEFENEYMKRKVIFKRRQHNEEQTIILDMYRVLIVYAQK